MKVQTKISSILPIKQCVFVNEDSMYVGFVPKSFKRLTNYSLFCRVPIGSSLFDKVPTPDPKFNNDMYYCNCNQAKKLVDCRLDGKAARPALHVSNKINIFI